MGIEMKTRKMVVLILITFIALILPSQLAYAEGPGTGGRRIRLDEEPAGPYVVRVVTSPTPPKVENLYLEIRVLNAESRDILTDLTVTISASSTEGEDSTIEVIATHDNAPIPDEYAAHLLIPRAGVWSIAIQIDGPLGTGEVSFLERISSPSSLGPIISIGAPFAGLAILIFIFLRMQRDSMDKKQDSEEQP
jgi:hypothetical protein